ncbi:DEAD/DEAH box helicase [Rhizobium ruizarguesonis]
MSGTQPKQHQLQGFEWLRNCWTQGWPGALLADDMGLGKTFQALAFLAWIRDNMAARRGAYRALQGPILIVAPTSLLDNWKKEAGIHLKPGKLGSCAEAFGSGLKALKTRKSAGWTEEDALDVDYMRQAEWILTTYETLALYHRSFARIAYSIAIFDEMQKVKSPDSINSHTAKTMNIDFVLGMTGTPIENRLEDLWCIMDRIAPGYLGDLKSFSSTYGDEDPQALAELKAKMDRPQGNAPAIMLRRMKDDVAKDLPAKHIMPYSVAMPASQARAYDEAVAAAKAGSKTRKSMLETLHLLRGISLHPDRAGEANAYDAAWRMSWINSSARVQKAITLLEDIRGRSEKALVFLEDRAMQQTFAAAIAEHLNLPARPPIINGTMVGRQRQEIVDAFQKAPKGFDLLILSPKAAGIGLTITAANHVIHLSRWWNPAVEDQCNDRAFRIGQTKDVTIHLPMAIHPTHGAGSFDQKLHDLLERKRSLSRDMLAPPTSERDVDGLFADVVG